MGWSKLWVAGLVALSAAGAANAQNIVQNGSFSSGSLLDWNISQTSNYPWTVVKDPFGIAPPVGDYAVQTGCVGAGCVAFGTATANDLSQVLTTKIGSTYTLSFYVDNFNSPPNALDVYWNGKEVLAQSPVSNGSNVYQLVTVSGLVATGTSTKLEFLGQQDPGYMALNGISVTAVPEPPAYALMLAGLGGIAFVSSRRRPR